MPTTLYYKTIMQHVILVAVLAFGLNSSIVYAESNSSPDPVAHSDGISATISDAAITTKIKAAFTTEKRLSKSNLSVTTTNGVVTLSGMTKYANERQLAEHIAMTIDGVSSVDNNVKVPNDSKLASATKEAASDSWITTKVKSDILADSLAKGFDVNVNTVDGVVVLKGVLANQDAIDHVKDIAAKVKGVKGVETAELTVSTKK